MANTPRVVTGANQDITGRTITQDYQTPAYGATIAVTFAEQTTTLKFAQLTGATTINLDATNPLIGDNCTMLFSADGTNRVITWGTGCKADATTLTVTASKFAIVYGTFDGTQWLLQSAATV
jgi:hypothetical protein